MSTRNVRWGWQIPCAHPGCNLALEKWSEHGQGPPMLINPTEDWVIGSEGDGKGCRTYYAYCPEHAEPFRKWSGAYADWRDRRREIGRTTWNSILRFISPTLAHLETGKAVRKWESENPEPTPPWRS